MGVLRSWYRARAGSECVTISVQVFLKRPANLVLLFHWLGDGYVSVSFSHRDSFYQVVLKTVGRRSSSTKALGWSSTVGPTAFKGLIFPHSFSIVKYLAKNKRCLCPCATCHTQHDSLRGSEGVQGFQSFCKSS